MNSFGSKLPAILLEDRQGFTRSLDPSRKIIPFEVMVAERTLRLSISLDPRPIPLAELVPMACQLSQSIVDASSRGIEECDRRISCRKGCDACCSYLVPISPAEGYHIRDEIFKLPPLEQKTIFRSCHHTISKLIKRRVPDELFRTTRGQEERLEILSDWYKELGLQCPFLVNHACCIYDFRPLACREYMVTSHPSKCQGDSIEKAVKVPLPVRVAEVLAETCRILEGRESSFLLPLLPEYLKDNTRRSWTLYPAETVVLTFLEILAEFAQRNCTIAAHESTI